MDKNKISKTNMMLYDFVLGILGLIIFTLPTWLVYLITKDIWLGICLNLLIIISATIS